MARGVNGQLGMNPERSTGAANRRQAGVDTQRLQRLVRQALPGAQIVRVAPLKPDASPRGETAKGAGYGAPLRIDILEAGSARSLVLHTATPNEFGHDRRADRAAEMVLAADTFSTIPGHARVLDVGAFRGEEEFVSLAGTGEFYVLTTFANGRLYADDLRNIASTGQLTAIDIRRFHVLVEFLAELRRDKQARSPAVYARCIRDTIGGGEGVFGIIDSYPEGEIPSLRLERIEELCVAWRHRLKRRAERLARTHGDFHPFNVLFDEHSALSLLDTSRGSVGEPADDVACMSINYPFFSLGQPGAWRNAFQSLWYGFWERYVSKTGDDEVYSTAAPFLAWRGVVLANPKWYPALKPEDRERILSFVETVLRADRLELSMADEFFDQ